VFQTKQQIAVRLIDHALTNGIRVAAWTFDELYSRDSKFLDALQQRNQAFIGEIPKGTHLWTARPNVIRKEKKRRGRGRKKKTPRVDKRPRACRVENLLKHSPKLRKQRWQRYRIKNTLAGPEVWEVKWTKVWRKTAKGLPSTQHTLIITRNVRTGEVKYFLSNKVVGRDGVTLRWLLRVAFGRWVIEASFRIAKEELGLDHFEVRGWRCIHRHYYLTGLSFLLCSRLRQELDPDQTGTLTVEQVRRSLNIWLTHHDLPPPLRDAAFKHELADQDYYQHRNQQAQKSHTKTRHKLYERMGIDVNKIKTCIT